MANSSRTVKVRAIRSDGQVFEYQSEDWKITSLSGLDFPNFEIFQEDRGFGNGSIITGKRKEARDIDIEAREINSKNNVIDRARTIGFHNSNYTFDLHITYMGVKRIAKGCQLQGAKCPTDNVYKNLVLTVSFLHPESDLLGEGAVDTKFTSVIPMWHAARVYKRSGGSLIFGIIKHTTEKWINYLGSEDTYIHCEIEAAGLVEGINLGVGNIMLNVNITLSSGDKLVIDSETKSITIDTGTGPEELPPAKYNGENLPKLVLKYGDNFLKLQANDPGVTAFSAEITYTGRYGGL